MVNFYNVLNINDKYSFQPFCFAIS